MGLSGHGSEYLPGPLPIVDSCPVSVRVGLLLCCCLAILAASEADDPRPHVLVLGSSNCLPWGVEPAWPEQVAEQLPHLRITTVAARNRLLHQVRGQLSATLDDTGPVEAVVIAFGQADAANEVRRRRDERKFARDLTKLINAIRNDARSSDATIAIATGLPVIDANLDTWMRPAYSPESVSGENRSERLADAAREVAADTGCLLIDIHEWVSGNEHGTVIGPTGIYLEDAGHTDLATWMLGEFRDRVRPQPRDRVAAAAPAGPTRLDRVLDEI